VFVFFRQKNIDMAKNRSEMLMKLTLVVNFTSGFCTDFLSTKNYKATLFALRVCTNIDIDFNSMFSMSKK